MKYQLDQKIPFTANLLYGLQWWIVSLPSMVIIGAVLSKLHYQDTAMQTLYMQKIFAIMGFTTIVQVVWGHRLPLVIGPASVLLVGVLASLSAGVSAIYTAVMMGGVLLSLVAFSGLLTKLRFVFTSRVISVILLLIPFTLIPTIIRLILDNQQTAFLNLSFTLLLILFLLLLNKWLKGIWKSTVVLWGLVVGTFVFLLINGLPKIEPSVYSMQLLREHFFVGFEFDTGTLIAFLFCYIALLINELGSIEAVGEMLKSGHIEKRIRQGVGITGLSNVLSGLTGTVGSVDYSMSTGMIAATGCASRYTLIPAGLGFIACAFFSQLVHWLIHIPGVVMGALLMYLMATQLSAGLTMLVQEKAVDSFDHGIIVGLPLMVAVLIAFVPATVAEQIPGFLKPIIGNGFVMGVLTVLLLEHVLLKKKR